MKKGKFSFCFNFEAAEREKLSESLLDNSMYVKLMGFQLYDVQGKPHLFKLTNDVMVQASPVNGTFWTQQLLGTLWYYRMKSVQNKAVDEVRDKAAEGLSFISVTILCQVSRDGKEDYG